MKSHHIMGLAIGYLLLGGVWIALADFVLPATTVPPSFPPGGAAGQFFLWPVAVATYSYAKVTGG